MIKSQLLLDVFNLTFEGLEHEDSLRNQIQFLSEGETEHTGVGLFINFETEKGVEAYKIPTEKAENRNTCGQAYERINGIEMRNEKLKILADIDVTITDGIIDCVQIWNKIDDYPTIEPTAYELEQVWVDSKKRKLIRNGTHSL
jgi:hypothetical protein